MEIRKVKKHHRRSSSSLISYYENSDVHKRRKRRTATDDLPIDLVFEILHRLDLKSATRCKSVSKEWCSVITHPFFVRCFVNSRPIVDHHHWPFTLLLQYTNRRTKNGHLLLPLEEEPYYKSLPYIPPMYQEQRHSEFNIQASCHDLFLCSASASAVVSDHNTTPFFYYVINPITRQWTALPPLPDQYTASVVVRRPRIGFICNSCCDILLHHHQQLSFRVMLIPEFEGVSTEFKVYIFSSDTSKWSESVVLCPAPHGFRLGLFAFPAVPYNGLLFWWSRNGFLVGFDPYKEGPNSRGF